MVHARRTKFVNYDARRDPKTDHFCCCCQRDIGPNTVPRLLYLANDMSAVHPEDVLGSERADDYGWKAIGPECAKRLGLEWSRPA